MIIIPDKLRRPAEVEREELRKQLTDARAEIERLVSEIENKQYTITCAAEENQQLKESLAEAQAEIERLKPELREISDSCSKSNLDVEMMAMLKRTTLAIKYITDGTIQSNSMLNVLLIESAELIKKMEA